MQFTRRGTVCANNRRGDSWVKEDLGNDADLFSIAFINDTDGLMVGGLPTGSAILRTEDAGLTWTSEDSNTSNPLFDVFMTSTETAYAVGFNGTILRSGDIVNAEDLIEFSMDVYPNPFTTQLNLKGDLTQDLVYKLIDNNGREHKSGKLLQNESIDTRTLPSGLYILKLITKEREFSTTLIKR